MEPFAAVGPLIDPAANSLHILLVAANLKSRQAVEATLYSCNYQVTACKTSQEAIQVLKAQQGPEGSANFDLILKDHCPSSGTNTCRFLRRAQHEQLLQGIPVIVASAEEDRDLMVNCLQLGAADFMLKPLRASDLRNLWARVYWWRRATYHQPTVASTPALNNDSRSGSASDETREQTTEPQDAALDQGLCAEGSEPTIKSTLGRSNESGDQSKGNQGWSGDKTNGDSKPGTQQGSNNPSIPSQHTTDPACLMNVPSSLGGYHGNSVPRIPPDFTPLDLQTRQNQPHKPTANAAEPRAATTGANPGFRAYVATEQQNQGVKRSLPDLNSREDPGSSGSDWTNSLDKANQNKRQAVQSIPEANGYNMSNGISALTQAWVQGQQTQQNYQSQPNLNQQPANNRAATDQVRADEKVNNGSGNMPPPSNMPPGFPFCFVPGMMPPPFAMPQFWNQANGDNKNHQNMSMAMMFPSFGNTTRNGADGDNGNMQQQAQQAMHNQIMYHHNLLMQQYGMTPPFMQFSAFANAAHKQPSQELNHQLPIPVVAKRHKTHPGTIPNSSSQMILNSKSMTPNENLTSSNTRGPQRQNGMQPPSQANGESVNPSDTARNANGQMGVDGFLLEPSRKQRRAEALHKYKQKRKNLNFTKKIRYESRKQLAQARPRVKGQFVRITSEDVNAVVDSLTPAQMKGVADGTTDVTQLLMANAKTGDAAVKQEDLANRDPEISDEDESEPIEEDDVSSPASKDCAEKSHAFASIPLPSLPSPQQVAELIVQIEKKGRNSSHSGSNSPDAENEGTLPQIADGVQCIA